MENLTEDRKYYVEIYNKLQDIGEETMLGRISRGTLKAELDNVTKHCKALFREGKISKPEFNKLIKLIDSYRDI